MNKFEKTIYKYHAIDKFLYNIIVNHEIWFSNPLNFNDPFDSNLEIEPVKSFGEAEKILRNLGASEEITLLKEMERENGNLELLENTFKDIASQISKNFGISCFSYTKESILMWSHYSNNHQGVCLKFIPEYDEDFFRMSLDVEYVSKYPKLSLKESDLLRYLSESSRFKYTDWDYEEEVRVAKIDGEGLKKYNIGALREIIFGCKTSPKDRESVMRIISKMGYTHIEFSMASMNKDSFTLDFEPLQFDEEKRIIERENKNFMNIELENFVKGKAIELAAELIDDKINPRHIELYQDILDFLLSLDEKDREEYLENRLSENKEFLKSLISDFKKRNKSNQ